MANSIKLKRAANAALYYDFIKSNVGCNSGLSNIKYCNQIFSSSISLGNNLETAFFSSLANSLASKLTF